MFNIKSQLKNLYVERMIRRERVYESHLVLKDVISGGLLLSEKNRKLYQSGVT